MMDMRRIRGMLGFARKSGNTVLGTDAVCEAMAKSGKGKAKLIVISDGASDGTQKKLTVKADFYSIPYIILPLSKEELGRIVGKDAPTVCIAVISEDFAKEIIKASGALASENN